MEPKKLLIRIEMIKTIALETACIYSMDDDLDILISTLPRLMRFAKVKIRSLYDSTEPYIPTMFEDEAYNWQFIKGENYVQNTNRTTYDCSFAFGFRYTSPLYTDSSVS